MPAIEDGKATEATLLYSCELANYKCAAKTYNVLQLNVGADILKLLFGENFYHEVEYAGLLDPAVIRPPRPSHPAQPPQQPAEPQCRF